MSQTITTTVTVKAPPRDVWDVLVDLPGHRHWNPFITAAAGTLEVGQRLHLTIQPPGGRPMSFKPTVIEVEPHTRLEWLGRLGLPGIFDGRHSFVLTPLQGERTLVQHSETFSGALVPFVGSMLDRTRAGFVAMNEALASHVATSRTVDGAPERGTGTGT